MYNDLIKVKSTQSFFQKNFQQNFQMDDEEISLEATQCFQLTPTKQIRKLTAVSIRNALRNNAIYLE